jgi:hypothetical protein
MRFADFGVPLRAAGALPAMHSGHAGCASRIWSAAKSGRGIVVALKWREARIKRGSIADHDDERQRFLMID